MLSVSARGVNGIITGQPCPQYCPDVTGEDLSHLTHGEVD